jgi:hypothetical protein
MEATIITAIIGAIATIAAAYITARTKDRSYADRLRQNLSSPMLSPSEYGIKIVTPADYERVDTGFSVSGTYENLPEGHHIWVSTFGVATDSKGNKFKHYWPQEKATTENGKWYSKVYNIGGPPGESKEFMVLVVGKEGQALIKYFKDAGNENQKWPPIKKLTSDIVTECAIGKIRLK